MAIRLEPQLDGSKTESVDCGVASTVMAIDYASAGKVRSTTERVRAKMNDQGPTNPWDWQSAIRAFKDAARKSGMKPLRSTIADGSDFDRLETLLFQKKRPVVVALDYGTIARKSPRLWSSTSFEGAHAVLLRVGRERGGTLKVKVFDPLADGRTVAGKKMVNGPRWWEWAVAKEACGNIRDADGKLVYPKRDGWLGLVVWRSKPIVPDEPEEPDVEPPLDDPDAEPDEPADTLDALADASSDIDDAIDALTTAPNAKGIAAALKAMRSARESIGPFMPPDSDSTSDSGKGIRPRPSSKQGKR
jgi:hypothetical protein